MRNLTRWTILSVLCLYLLGAGSAWAVDDAIIAVVNDEVITLKDLRDYIHQTYVSLVAQGVEESQIKEMMAEMEKEGVNKLIEDRLILSRANTIGIKVNEKLVDERISDVKKRYPSDQAFLDDLIRQGMNITELRNKILEQLKIKFAIDHEVKTKVFVNPQEVTDFYAQNQAQFQRRERLNLDSIYIAFKDAPDEARARAQTAVAALQAGKSFQEVAGQYSDMPSIGTVERGQLLPEVEKVIFDLNDDEVSSPVETKDGIFIFKLEGRTAPEVAPLKEVKEQIYNLIYRKKFKDQMEHWLAKLKKDAYVEIKQ